ncbi:MAG TPA: LytTR family DNA-binding domain-containing protein [Prolixibacteraceae bacterium]|nr:LytTR family DNA-binding domain-containing protein [Prolixibacteraceae bacterium]HPT30542.1 LytTR family DNA-binding domain-containing protein [Prolixibacteraceae bacterium]
MKINCIAVDDEPLALDIISAYCAKMPFLNLQKTFDNALDTLEYLRNNPVDLIFLDIQMGGLTGIQLLNALKNKPHVILTTAFDSYAVQGFDLDVTDYLLKPISFERFIKGVNKVYEKIQSETTTIPQEKSAPLSPQETEPTCFFVKTETRIEKVNAADILYVEGMSDYWRIVTTSKRIMTLMNAKGIEEMLREPRFCRVHKSYFIALDKIDFVERKHIKIGNERIPISDTYQKRFFELIEKKKSN